MFVFDWLLDVCGAAYGWSYNDVCAMPASYLIHMGDMAEARLANDPLRSILVALGGGG